MRSQHELCVRPGGCPPKPAGSGGRRGGCGVCTGGPGLGLSPAARLLVGGTVPPPPRARLPTSLSSPATACAAVGQPVQHRCSRSSVLVCPRVGCVCPSGIVLVTDACLRRPATPFTRTRPPCLLPPHLSPLSVAPPPPSAVSTLPSYPTQPHPSTPPRPPLRTPTDTCAGSRAANPDSAGDCSPPPPVAFGCAVLPLPRLLAGGSPHWPMAMVKMEGSRARRAQLQKGRPVARNSAGKWRGEEGRRSVEE
eukprot:gene12993-biopygen3476